MSEVAAKQDSARYLDPAVIARIQRLDLRTRLIVEGFISGLHRSPYQGFSVEFAQHREYVPGDDVRHIDWKVFARSDRYYIKQYEEETNLRCVFLVDVSESMKYGGTRLTKYDYAASITASLALLLLRQQDAVGLCTFDEDLRTVLPPSARTGHINSIVHVLEEDSRRLLAKTSLEHICHKVAEKLDHRGMVCIVSDLLEDEDGLLRGLRRLVHRGHDVMVLHVMDASELTFPFQGNTRFRGMEASGDLIAEPRSLREGYLASLQRYLEKVKRGCISNRVSYRLASTEENLGAVLGAFLSYRIEVGRKASSKHR